MSARQGKQPPFEAQLVSERQALSDLGEKNFYDRAVLSVRRSKLVGLADSGLVSHEIDQQRSIEVKRDAAELSGRVATKHGDIIYAGDMDELVRSYDDVLDVLKKPEDLKPSQTKAGESPVPPKKQRQSRRPAQTTKANTGKAKS